MRPTIVEQTTALQIKGMGVGVIMATLKEILGEAYKEGMTVEEIENAIATKKLVDISTGAYVSISKYQALENERNDFKQKWSDTLTEAQKAEQKAIEEQQKYEAIMKENALYKHKQKLSKTIKDETALDEIATLYANGDLEGAFEKQNAYFEKANAEMEQKIKADLMAKNPQGTPQGNDQDQMTKEQYNALPLAQKQKLATENAELYKKFNT